MCSQKQIGNTYFCEGQLYRLMAFPKWLYMIYRYRVFFVLHIFHDTIWGLLLNDNAYLILSLHEVLHKYRKIKMLGTELCHMKFYLIFVTHLCCLVHDTHAQSTFVYWHVFCPCHDSTSNVPVLGLKDILKFPCLWWRTQ